MIIHHKGSIFDTDPATIAIAHQANCQNTLANGTASGIAKLIGLRYPEAMDADHKMGIGRQKFKKTSIAQCHDGRIVFNVYGQLEYGAGRQTDYEALYCGLTEVAKYLTYRNKQDGTHIGVAFPYGMGCCRGGASWRIVLAMIETIFDLPFKVMICRLPSQADIA
jgi:hypothetical protein